MQHHSLEEQYVLSQTLDPTWTWERSTITRHYYTMTNQKVIYLRNYKILAYSVDTSIVKKLQYPPVTNRARL